jgi:hypothetical protein
MPRKRKLNTKTTNTTNGKAPAKKTAKKKNLTDREKVEALEKLFDGVPGRENPYGTIDLETFHEKIDRMNLFDLQELAIKAGEVAMGSEAALKRRLIKDFEDRFANKQPHQTRGETKRSPYSKTTENKVKELFSKAGW